MRRSLLCASTILTLNALGTTAFAASQDAAYDRSNKTVSDSFGHCVRTKWQGENDACGTPAPKPAAKVAPVLDIKNTTLEQRTLYFDFNSARLTAAAQTKLNSLSAAINQSSEVKSVTIHGFTDQIGTAQYNDTLASKRAAAVKSYLDSHSKLKSEIGDIRGIGKSEPTASCTSIQARQAKIDCMAPERRVEVEIKLDE